MLVDVVVIHNHGRLDNSCSHSLHNFTMIDLINTDSACTQVVTSVFSTRMTTNIWKVVHEIC